MMNDAIVSRTYVSTVKTRANEVGGASELTYRDTIFADGRVEWSGWSDDDGYVNQRGVRHAEQPINFDRVHAARISSGWNQLRSSARGANQLGLDAFGGWERVKPGAK